MMTADGKPLPETHVSMKEDRAFFDEIKDYNWTFNANDLYFTRCSATKLLIYPKYRISNKQELDILYGAPDGDL